MEFVDYILFALKKNLFFHEANLWGKKILHESTLSKDEIYRIQMQRCQDLLRFVFQKIPFYRRKYQSCGIELSDFAQEDIWDSLPILTKKEVRENYHDFLVKGDRLEYLLCNATGGSTGEPVKFFRSPEAIDNELGRYFYHQIGIRPWSSVALVGRKIPNEDSLKYKFKSLFIRPHYIHLDAKLMSQESMTFFAKRLCKKRLYYIYGYAGGIYEFALFLQKNSIRIYPPLAIICTSAPITDFQRRKMEEIFCSKVFNQYGCCEIPWLAMECLQQKGLHVLDTARKIDIVDENIKPCAINCQGNILISNLLEYRFPLIRYQVGDRAAKLSDTCSCGSNLSRISAIMGRETDLSFKRKHYCRRLPYDII